MQSQKQFSPDKIHVLIADRDILTCRLLASRLRKHKSFEVMECAGPASTVLGTITKIRPSVVVISSTLEDDPVGGISVLRHARAEQPTSRAVVLLDKADKDLIVEAFRAGAKGVFIRSDFSFANLCKCVHSVHQGEIWAESQHLVYVLDTFASEDSPQRRSRSDGSSSLSKREREVMRLVVDGLSNREIATALGLSEHTIKNYVFRLFEKLGVYSRVELVHYALARHEPSSATPLAAKHPKQTKMREAAAMSIVR